MRIALFTPGPGNTSEEVKSALKTDIGSRTPVMISLTKKIREQLLQVAGCDSRFTAIPIQGCGTFAVEAMLTSLLRKNQHCLVVVNGPYGSRIQDICNTNNISYSSLELDVLKPISCSKISQHLDLHPEISALILVHFETGIGVYNDLDGIAKECNDRGISVFVDAMSSFGLFPINFKNNALVAIAASSNKILHGMPGMGFVIAKKELIESPLPTRTISLDLCGQYKELEKSGMWRFTPPVQTISSLSIAIDAYFKDGGAKGRKKRYKNISQIIVNGLALINIKPIISPIEGAPIITFLLPFPRKLLDVNKLSNKLFSDGFAIYPSTLCNENSFRIGFIGELLESDATALVEVIDLHIKSILSEG